MLTKIRNSIPSITEFVGTEDSENYEEMLSLLEMHNVPYKRNEQLVRGLDYYNGTCFEIKADLIESEGVLGKSQNTLIAGGRYDYLASIYTNGKTHVPAIGWAAGIDRLVLLLEHKSNNQREDQKG